MTRLVGLVVATALGVVGAVGVNGVGAGPVAAVPAAVLTPVSNPVVALPAAGQAFTVRYRSTSIAGEPVMLTGSLLLPKRPAPAAGWPLAVWNHMTTGGADACAPSRATKGSPSLAYMTSGDRIVEGLLDKGFAVVRPDYEGIGSPGPHPYLIGASLARAVIDAARAVAAAEPRIGRSVVVSGHSEGAVASLFAAAAPRTAWGGLRLKAVAAVTPPTRLGDIVHVVARVPVRAGAPTGELVALAALLISGASTVDPAFASLVAHGGGLSPAATALMPLVEKVCYRELAGPRAFGALAPADLLGVNGAQAEQRLAAIVDDNDVAHLGLPVSLPIRIDAGASDIVAPVPLVNGLVDAYRARGSRVDVAVHPGGHSQVPRDPAAAGQVADWLSRW